MQCRVRKIVCTGDAQFNLLSFELTRADIGDFEIRGLKGFGDREIAWFLKPELTHLTGLAIAESDINIRLRLIVRVEMNVQVNNTPATAIKDDAFRSTEQFGRSRDHRHRR